MTVVVSALSFMCELLLQMLLEFGATVVGRYGRTRVPLRAAVGWPHVRRGARSILAGPAIRCPAIVMATVIAVMLASALALTTANDAVVVITTQVLLALLRSGRHGAQPPAARPDPRPCTQAFRRASAP